MIRIIIKVKYVKFIFKDVFVQEFEAKHIGTINIHEESFTNKETGVFFADRPTRKIYI